MQEAHVARCVCVCVGGGVFVLDELGEQQSADKLKGAATKPCMITWQRNAVCFCTHREALLADVCPSGIGYFRGPLPLARGELRGACVRFVRILRLQFRTLDARFKR